MVERGRGDEEGEGECGKGMECERGSGRREGKHKGGKEEKRENRKKGSRHDR